MLMFKIFRDGTEFLKVQILRIYIVTTFWLTQSWLKGENNVYFEAQSNGTNLFSIKYLVNRP